MFIIWNNICSNNNLSSYFNFKINGGGNSNNTLNVNIKEEINPLLISKIKDNFDIGLDPFNSDNSSVSSSGNSIIDN